MALSAALGTKHLQQVEELQHYTGHTHTHHCSKWRSYNTTQGTHTHTLDTRRYYKFYMEHIAFGTHT